MKKHAVLPIGGKTWVVTWSEDPNFFDRRTIVTSSIDDFKSLYDRYRYHKDSDGNDKEAKLGTWWINHKARRQFDGGSRNSCQ